MGTTLDLKTYYDTQAATITDEGDRLEALDDIATWYATRLAIVALSGNSVSSYSIGGRSVTRQALPQLQDQEALLLAKVKGWIGRGGGGQVDMSGADEGLIV